MNYLLPSALRHARRSLLTAALLAVVFPGLSRSCVAASDEPELPAQFDRATVQNLVNHIDEGFNASILKGAYFDPHVEHPLPLNEGYNLLQAELQATPVDSKKWFYLQSTAAYAALRTGPDGRKDGLDAYTTMFDHAAQAIRNKAFYPLQRAAYEYVSAMPTPLVITAPGKLDGADGVLFKAFDAYLQLLKVGQEGRFEPEWEQVMPYTAFDSRYANAVSAALKDPATPKSLALYKTAARVYRYSDVEQAFKLLQGAKAVLPVNDAQQARDLYGLLVDLALSMQKWPLAISSQQELIARTGQGRARLAMLYLQNNKGNEYSTTLAGLHAANANEEDITNLAGMLLTWGARDPRNLRRARSDAESLLTAYVGAPRTRKTDLELVARLTLAESYVEQERVADARAVLAVSLKPASLDSDTAMLYDLARRKLRELGATKGGNGRPAAAPTAAPKSAASTPQSVAASPKIVPNVPKAGASAPGATAPKAGAVKSAAPGSGTTRSGSIKNGTIKTGH